MAPEDLPDDDLEKLEYLERYYDGIAEQLLERAKSQKNEKSELA